jgi:serpin B
MPASIDLAFEVANGLWVDKRIALEHTFTQTVERDFATTAESIDFNERTAAAVINDWVKARTHGHIPLLFNQLSQAVRFVIASAVYFHGRWETTFDAALTARKPFHAPSETRALPFMTRSGEFAYTADDTLEAIRLPYRGRFFSMFILLPRAGAEKHVAAQLEHKASAAWDRVAARHGTLDLPKMHLKYSANLNAPLQALGLGIAFEPRADFSGISRTPLSIDEVVHKSTLEVDEEGTEASAATGVAMRMTLARPNSEPAFHMTVDRPFICAIRDERTGAYIFLGRISEPA